MLHIILLILKILGILLLVLLGLILTALVLVLFVPLRYRFQGEYKESPRGMAKVTWLLHLVSVRIAYDGQASFTVKVLGFRLFQEKDGRGEAEISLERGEEELVHMAELGGEEVLVEETEYPPGKSPVKAENPPGEPSVKAEEPAAKTSLQSSEEDAKGSFPEPDGRLTGLLKWLGNFIKNLWHRIRDKLKSIAGSLSMMKDRSALLAKKYREVRDFLEDEENRKTFRLLLRQTKKLLRHLLPGKIKGRVRFGFDDPYYTGQVLAAASPFYGFYAKSLSLEPMFGEAVLEGSLEVKGRIRLASVLFIGLRVLLNKNFRVLLKKWRS